MINKSIILYWLMAFAAFILIGCSSNTDKSEKDSGSSPINKIDEAAPGTIKVLATIQKIYTDKLTNDEKSPCSKVPCNAGIIINKVLGRGHSFNELIHVGDSVDVNFAFTTAKTTKELFPNINKEYPGVSVGDKIITNLSGGSTLFKDKTVYSITDYEITGN